MPKDYSGQEPVGWFTAKGVHIPLYEGETPDDAIKRLTRDMLFDNMQSDTEYASFTGSSKSAMTTKAQEWFKENSNFEDWTNSLNWDERGAINLYAAESDDPGSYMQVNKGLNSPGYKKLEEWDREPIDQISQAIDKFHLYAPVQVTRASDCRMFGFAPGETPSKQKIIEKLTQTYGYMEYKGFLSSSADTMGRDVDASGVIVHIGVKPSIGAGAYLVDKRLVYNLNENEYLFARNTVLRYDIASLKKNRNGQYEINAEWVGRVEDD